MDGPSTSTNSGMQAPQKRVLPARSRRGGPGVGSCDIDLMILDRQKRRLEYDPLFPAETHIYLTTNPETIAKSSKLELGMNVHANDRYFDRPEVVKAYREQEIIQTPEFVAIPVETPGRLRPRNSEEGTADTSDVAYEKRHRKYEAFEKRIRLREKEKLKHEQYKLKERIDQLRAMDGGAFLSLPASSFSPIPGQRDGNPEDGWSTLPGARINGAAAHVEGERRRKEMLDVASDLEERYRILLPPDRFRKTAGPSNFNPPIEAEGEGSLDEEPVAEVTQKETERTRQSEIPKIKLKRPVKQGKSSKKRRKHNSPALEPVLPQANNEAPEPLILVPDVTDHEPTSLPSPQSEAASRSPTPISNPDIAVLNLDSGDVTLAPQADDREEDIEILSSAAPSPATSRAASPTPSVSRVSEPPETAPAARGRKRIKLSLPQPPSYSRNAAKETSVPPIESIPASAPKKVSRSQKQTQPHVSYAGAAGCYERTKSLLIVAASRRSDKSSRRTERHITVFGMKVVRDERPEQTDYVLPSWVMSPAEGSEQNIT